jgi:hypothetical protein
MNPIMTIAAFALELVAAGPPMSAPALQQALADYRAMLAGQKQMKDLSTLERQNVIELDIWLRHQPAKVVSETREQCRRRLIPRGGTKLEVALVDLKCSQRPSSGAAG